MRLSKLMLSHLPHLGQTLRLRKGLLMTVAPKGWGLGVRMRFFVPLKHHGAAYGISPLSVVFKAQKGCNCPSRSLAEDLLMVSHADPVAVI